MEKKVEDGGEDDLEASMAALGDPMLEHATDPILNTYPTSLGLQPHQQPGFIKRSGRLGDLMANQPYSVMVQNIPVNATREALRHLFSQYGTVLSCSIASPKDGQDATYGRVSFKTKNEAAASIAGLHCQDPFQLRISFHKKKNMEESLSKHEKAFADSCNREFNQLAAKLNQGWRDQHEKQYSEETPEESLVLAPRIPANIRPQNCKNCGKLGQVVCSRCKTWYCTRECQEWHWPNHMLDCLPPPPIIDPFHLSNTAVTKDASLLAITQQLEGFHLKSPPSKVASCPVVESANPREPLLNQSRVGNPGQPTSLHQAADIDQCRPAIQPKVGGTPVPAKDQENNAAVLKHVIIKDGQSTVAPALKLHSGNPASRPAVGPVARKQQAPPGYSWPKALIPRDIPQPLLVPGQSYRITAPGVSFTSPSHFNIQLAEGFANYTKILEILKTTEPSNDFVMSRHSLVTVTHDGSRERSMAVKKLGDHIFNFYLLDTGALVTKELTTAAILPDAVKPFPVCAVQACLMDVAPFDGEGWSETACNVTRGFLNSDNANLQATVRGRLECGRVAVEVTKLLSGRSVNLADFLVQAKHGRLVSSRLVEDTLDKRMFYVPTDDGGSEGVTMASRQEEVVDQKVVADGGQSVSPDRQKVGATTHTPPALPQQPTQLLPVAEAKITEGVYTVTDVDSISRIHLVSVDQMDNISRAIQACGRPIKTPPTPGQMYGVKLDNTVVRAVLVGLSDEADTEVLVSFVDRPGLDNRRVADLLDIGGLSELPSLVVTVGLAGLKPKGGGNQWRAEDVELFKELVDVVDGIQFHVTPMGRDEQGNILVRMEDNEGTDIAQLCLEMEMGEIDEKQIAPLVVAPLSSSTPKQTENTSTDHPPTSADTKQLGTVGAVTNPSQLVEPKASDPLPSQSRSNSSEKKQPLVKTECVVTRINSPAEFFVQPTGPDGLPPRAEYRVSLAGIKPPTGDSSAWPQESLDWFREVCGVNSAKFEVTTLGVGESGVPAVSMADENHDDLAQLCIELGIGIEAVFQPVEEIAKQQKREIRPHGVGPSGDAMPVPFKNDEELRSEGTQLSDIAVEKSKEDPIIDSVTKLGSGEPIQSGPAPTRTQVNTVIPAELGLNVTGMAENTQCVVTHVNSPAHLYVMPVADLPLADTVFKLIQAPAALVNLKTPTKGQPCLAQVDQGAFVRARVEAVSPDGTRVRLFYSDIGRVEKHPLSEVWEMADSAAAKMPNLVHRVELETVAPDLDAAAVNRQFIELCGIKQRRIFTATVIRPEEPERVRLVNQEGEDVLQLINSGSIFYKGPSGSGEIEAGIKESTAVPSDTTDTTDSKGDKKPNANSSSVEEPSDSTPSPGEKGDSKPPPMLSSLKTGIKLSVKTTECTVAHVTHPNNFYILPCEAEQALTEIRSCIKESRCQVVNSPPAVGEVCLAEWNQQWHRVVVINTLSSDDTTVANVRYIDHGRTESLPVTKLRQLPNSSSCGRPGLAHRVSLVGLKSGFWSAEEVDFFRKLCETKFQLTVVGESAEHDGPAQLVQLIDPEGNNLRDLLVDIMPAAAVQPVQQQAPDSAGSQPGCSRSVLTALRPGDLVTLMLQNTEDSCNIPAICSLHKDTTLDYILDAMQSESEARADTHRVDVNRLTAGEFIVVWSENDLTHYRGQVVAVDTDKVAASVNIIDFGFTAHLPLEGMLRLWPEAGLRPACGLRLRALDGTGSKSNSWSKLTDSSETFRVVSGVGETGVAILESADHSELRFEARACQLIDSKCDDASPDMESSIPLDDMEGQSVRFLSLGDLWNKVYVLKSSDEAKKRQFVNQLKLRLRVSRQRVLGHEEFVAAPLFANQLTLAHVPNRSSTIGSFHLQELQTDFVVKNLRGGAVSGCVLEACTGGGWTLNSRLIGKISEAATCPQEAVLQGLEFSPLPETDLTELMILAQQPSGLVFATTNDLLDKLTNTIMPKLEDAVLSAQPCTSPCAGDIVIIDEDHLLSRGIIVNMENQTKVHLLDLGNLADFVAGKCYYAPPSALEDQFTGVPCRVVLEPDNKQECPLQFGVEMKFRVAKNQTDWLYSISFAG